MEQNYNNSKSNIEATPENCPVCLEIPATETTECCHKFCSSCLDKWLVANNSCPICRSKLNNNSIARSGSNNFYIVPWSVQPEDPTYMPQSNYSRIDTIPDVELRLHPDSYSFEEPFINAPVFNTNVSVMIPKWPDEFRGAPYIRLEFPSITDNNCNFKNDFLL